MQAAKYDPMLIRQFADGQYSRATWAIITSTCAGFLVGLMLFMGAVTVSSGGGGLLVGGATMGVSTMLGLMTGLNRAFWIRLEAQRMLVPLQIEINTRPQVEAPGPATSSSARQSEAPYRGGPVV